MPLPPRSRRGTNIVPAAAAIISLCFGWSVFEDWACSHLFLPLLLGSIVSYFFLFWKIRKKEMNLACYYPLIIWFGTLILVTGHVDKPQFLIRWLPIFKILIAGFYYFLHFPTFCFWNALSSLMGNEKPMGYWPRTSMAGPSPQSPQGILPPKWKLGAILRSSPSKR